MNGEEVVIHSRVRYKPETDKFEWVHGIHGGEKMTCVVSVESFARIVEYYKMVLASTTEYRD
jgi:hypothetical protein